MHHNCFAWNTHQNCSYCRRIAWVLNTNLYRLTLKAMQFFSFALAQFDFYFFGQNMLILSWRIFCWGQKLISSLESFFMPNVHFQHLPCIHQCQLSQILCLMKSISLGLRRKCCLIFEDNHFLWRMHTKSSHYWGQLE